MKATAELKEFLLNISTNIFLEINSYGQILYASSKAQYVFHIHNRKDMFIFEVFEASDTNYLKEHIKNVIYQQYPENFKLEYQERYYNIFAYPFGENVILSLDDITEKRQLSHYLYQTKSRLEFAERTAHLGYWELDLTSKHFYWSAEMYRIFGVDASNVSLKRNLIREQLFPEDLDIYKNKLNQLLKFGNPVEGQVRIRKSDGKVAYCQFKAGITHRDFTKTIAGTLQDITPLAETQLAYQRAKQEADKSNMAKSYFLAQASHDLRQPMQALNIFIENLTLTNLNGKQQQIVEKIQESSHNLKNMLDNLLDISKLDAGGTGFQPQTFNLADFLCKICHEYRILGEADGLKILCRLNDIKITTDIFLLERVIRNLLSNALKYARHRILISCRQNSRHQVEIYIIDDGRGIQQQEINRIFDEFYQCRNDLSERRCGAGLGLSIVRKIMKILGGTVRVKSRPGHYTVFKITLTD